MDWSDVAQDTEKCKTGRHGNEPSDSLKSRTSWITIASQEGFYCMEFSQALSYNCFEILTLDEYTHFFSV